MFFHMGFQAVYILEKCKSLGVVLTGAGATYPYGIDPEDSNIRIAPTFPTPEEMEDATKIFILCVSPDFMPSRYSLVDWEPWKSMGMHKVPVDNFVVYYTVNDGFCAVETEDSTNFLFVAAQPPPHARSQRD